MYVNFSYISVAGFTSPSMGDSSSTGPLVVWCRTETAAVVISWKLYHVSGEIQKNIYGGTPEKDCGKRQDSTMSKNDLKYKT